MTTLAQAGQGTSPVRGSATLRAMDAHAHGDRRVTFKYVDNSAIEPEVAEVLKRFDANGDGTVTASDLVAGASALQQLRSANHILRRVVLMLFVVALVVLLGSFGCTLWAIDLSKELAVSGDVLVTSDGGAVRVAASDLEVVAGKLRQRSPSQEHTEYQAPAAVKVAEERAQLHAVEHDMGMWSFPESEVRGAFMQMKLGGAPLFVLHSTVDGGSTKRTVLIAIETVGSGIDEETGGWNLAGSARSAGPAGDREFGYEVECARPGEGDCVVELFEFAGELRLDERGAARRLQSFGYTHGSREEGALGQPCAAGILFDEHGNDLIRTKMCGCMTREQCGLMSWWGRGEVLAFYSNDIVESTDYWAYDGTGRVTPAAADRAAARAEAAAGRAATQAFVNGLMGPEEKAARAAALAAAKALVNGLR